jgi:cell division protein FtsW (lipid II flippase)
MSYGGTHLLVEFIILGIVISQSKYARTIHREEEAREFIGPK